MTRPTASDWDVSILTHAGALAAPLDEQDLTGLTYTRARCAAGSWSLNAPDTAQCASALTQPGARISITEPDGTTVTGMVECATWSDDPSSDLGRHWEFTGVMDAAILGHALCLPDPSKGLTEQTDTATWTGTRAALARRALACLAAQGVDMTVGQIAGDGMGGTVTIGIDFQTVLDALTDILPASCALTVSWPPGAARPTATVTAGRDMTRLILFDTDSGQITRLTASRKAPTATRWLVKTGSGDDQVRAMYTTDAMRDLEAAWGARTATLTASWVENDATKADEKDDEATKASKTAARRESQQAAMDTAAATQAQTVLDGMASATATLADDVAWDGLRLGDVVTVQTGLGVASAPVETITTGFTDGPIRTASLGEWDTGDAQSIFTRAILRQAARTGRLERRLL